MRIEMDEASGWVGVITVVCLLLAWWSHTKACETVSMSTREECARACGIGNVQRTNSIECVCANTNSLDAGAQQIQK
jgi:hypothetical protein